RAGGRSLTHCYGVDLQEPSTRRIVLTGPQVIQIRRVEILGRKLHWIVGSARHVLCFSFNGAEWFIGVGPLGCACRRGHVANGSECVVVVVVVSGTASH